MFLTVIDLLLQARTLISPLISLLNSPPDEIVDDVSERARNKSLNIFYTNADQFLNKRDLLLVQITSHTTPDIILISEMLPKAPNVAMSLSLFALPGYALYLNFDPENSNSDIRGVGIFVNKRLKANQVSFNPTAFMDQVWISIRLQGSDTLLVGCIYHSPSQPLNTSVSEYKESDSTRYNI